VSDERSETEIWQEVTRARIAMWRMERQPVPVLPDQSDAVKALNEALTELRVVKAVDQARSLLDYLAQRGWDLVRRKP
jgi:hypothetical protein